MTCKRWIPVSVKYHMKKGLVPGLRPWENFWEYSNDLDTTNIRPVSAPPNRRRGSRSISSRFMAWTARATDQELVSRMSVSMPPRCMLSVCRDASKTAGFLSRSCMKLRNRIAKMTESAPMKTQTPSTPGRRLGFTESAVTTPTRLSVDEPSRLVLGLEPRNGLDDVVGQRGDPEEPGEERDPESDHAVEGQRPGRDERDRTHREERRESDPAPPAYGVRDQFLLPLVAHEDDADCGDLQRGDKVRQVKREPAKPVEHVHDFGREIIDLMRRGQPNRHSHHDGCTGNRATQHLELRQNPAGALNAFHYPGGGHAKRHVEGGHREADAQRNQQPGPELLEVLLDLDRRRAGRERRHIASEKPPEDEDGEQEDRAGPGQDLPCLVIGRVGQQPTRVGDGGGFGVYCHRTCS